MSRIVAKLNLNKTPQLVENNSLVMAKNIRLLEDGTIGPDTSLEEIETKVGNGTQETIQHEAVTKEFVTYRYTILDCDTTIAYIRDDEPVDEENLEEVAFNFVNYHPNTSDADNAIAVRTAVSTQFVEESSEDSCIIYCYALNDETPEWVSERFIYDPNDNALINNNGFWLMLAVREDIYNETTPPSGTIPEYYYIILPKLQLNSTVVIDKYNYVAINPVYPTNTEEEVTEAAYSELRISYDTVKYIGQIVGLDNKIYFFREQSYIPYSEYAEEVIIKLFPGECFVHSVDREVDDVPTFDVDAEGYITRRGVRFEDREVMETLYPIFNDRVRIFEFDEIAKTFTAVKCGWRYSGGEINGCVFKNNTGNSILTICEYNVPNSVKVPIKHINLSSCKPNDDESIYTQNPNIPITNLILNGEYNTVILSGVYQFFIRYKIHDNRYTSWFPCSKECFAGTKKRVSTTQGELKYIDKHQDSDTSFIFDVHHLYPGFNNIYKKFQIGFILSKDDESIIAREWKEFDFNTSTIYFDCLSVDIQDANIDDLLENTYEIFNVENCVNYKNKLYIANYEETDFNPDLKTYAQQIQVKLNAHTIGSVVNGTFFDGELLISSNNNHNYDYIGEYGIPINIKWPNSNYFDLPTPVVESTDATGYFDSFTGSLHRHIGSSNVLIGDYVDWNGHINYGYASAAFEDEEEPFQDVTYGNYTFPKKWVQSLQDSTHQYIYDNACILAIYVKDGNNYIQLVTDYRSGQEEGYYTGFNAICSNDADQIGTICDGLINSRIGYYNTDDDNWYILGIDNNYHAIRDYYIVYSTMDRISSQLIEPPFYGYHPNGTQYNPKFTVVTTRKTVHILKRTLVFDTSVITTTAIGSFKEYPTLLPYTAYNFYIHYIKQNGVITNGYLINDDPVCTNYYAKDSGLGHGFVGNVGYYSLGNTITLRDDDDIILYPSFENIQRPDGYVGCFISVAKVGNNVCQLFNVEVPNTQINGKYVYKADCLELDTLCYTKFTNLKIYTSDNVKITDEGKYYDSGNTENVKYFGECGSVIWETNTIIETVEKFPDNMFWLVINTNETAKRLIKYTPYIQLKSSSVSYNNYEDITNIGFTCYVKKLKKEIYNTSVYINTTDVYVINRENAVDGSNARLSLTETTNEQYYRLIRDNYEARIKSNFNLNFMNLRNDITVVPKTIDATVDPPVVKLVSLVDSLTSSLIYEFNSWYKTYTRKHYSIYEYNKHTRFDNTIRTSRVIGDEEYNTFKFDATDYYNVPALRGIITNLISIANSVYVHCEHSLFRFSDNKTLNAQEEEVTLQENDIFNSGIAEVFDAQYGYAGLKKREQSLITYNAYVFYDDITKTIYAFGGEQQIGSISEPIKKLINAFNPDDVRFVGDEQHNRFFVNLINRNGNICLSFNFNSKSFVSIHDIEFKFGFHTRRHTYFIHENKNGNIVSGWSIYRIVDILKVLVTRTEAPNPDPEINAQYYQNHYAAYQNCYKKSAIHVADCDENVVLNEYKAVNSCVDIIVNTEYEKIKVLNYISWISSEIQRYGSSENSVAEEVLDRKYPGTRLRIYSDSTKTSLFELLDFNGNPKIANENRNIDSSGNISPNSRNWQYPQYNCGIWSMNYFRDIENCAGTNRQCPDIFDYTASENGLIGEQGYPGTSPTTDLIPKITRERLTQENSLLYGKYFVVRFIFNNKNFKLENVILKMNDYEKTK